MDLKPAVALIREFESCKLKAYKDPVGIWTIGYGTTKGVRPGMVITQPIAEALMQQEIHDVCLPAIKRLVKVACTNNEICAMISFSYNVGIGALGRSTLMRKLNANASDQEVADEFLKWNMAGGKVLSGLVRRRKAERELFLTREPVTLT